MRVRLAWLVVSLAAFAVTQACGGTDSTDDGGLDSGGDDVTVDNFQPPPDSGTDDVVVDDTGTGDTGTTGDASDGGTAQDTGVPIAIWKCGATTVTDCTQCTGYTQPCAYCQLTDASVVNGVCTLINDNCANSIPQGFQDCLCADASTCPEDYQVCTTFGRCHTCSDNTAVQGGNTGLTCQGGGTCNATDGGCN